MMAAVVLLSWQTGYSINIVGKQVPHLFKIVKDDRIGFIDSAGNVVIAPQYKSANDFSEGLASVRINGTYGFINESGNFVIPPQYDYATFFSEGLAVVYKNGKPFYINTKGEKAFDCIFPAVDAFHNGRAKVGTKSKHLGYIDKSGNLIIDTIFSTINPFIDGVAVVSKVNKIQTGKDITYKSPDIGVIDTFGRFVIPYGRYTEIKDLEGGYFRATSPTESRDTIKGYTARTIFTDKTGRQVLIRKDTALSYVDGGFHCGLAKIYLYKYWIPEEKGVISTSEKAYHGFINLKGEIVINDTMYRYVNDFSDNRAFVRDEGWHVSLINTKGNVIADKVFDGVKEGFRNGIVFVSVQRHWGIIDTNAHFIVKPQFDDIDDVGIIDDYFFFKNEGRVTKIGVARIDGSIIIPAMLDEYDKQGFKGGILKCIINKKLTYINKQNNIVWQETNIQAKHLANLDIDYMIRGYFFAHSDGYKTDLGGFGQSGNSMKKIYASARFPANSLSAIVKPDITDTFDDDYYGITAFIANTSTKKKYFSAEDSRLNMVVQALNEKGKWQDIEYLPHSSCGNSYHVLTLEPAHYWKFIIPRYAGDFKTKLRIKLACINNKTLAKGRRERKEVVIYSNEYSGSVNPGQFWRTEHYYHYDIMDPYDD